VRGEGGRLFNVLGERFMERYNPKQLELACRDFVSRSIYFEIKEGRGVDDCAVYLSVAHLPDHIIEQRLPAMLGRGLNYDVDIRKEPMLIYPSSHYQNGGIRVDTTWKTRVDHLYSAGESAGGVHGANRLGSNSLPDLLVSGKIAGENAARAALNNFKPFDMTNFKKEIERVATRVEDVVGTDNGVNPISIRNEIKDLIWDNVGIARSRESLNHALEVLEDIKTNRLPRIGSRGGVYNTEFMEALDVRSMIVSSECMTRGALTREESRCGHFREDFPLPKEEWTANIVATWDENGQFELEKIPAVQTHLNPDEVEMPIFPTSGKIPPPLEG
jgi:succinate dehydrogenase/fumarate reductase flavoprotein subunit